MEGLRLALLILLLAIRIVSILVQSVIYQYLGKKSPGMKTAFDELVQELILGGIATSFGADLCNAGLGPMKIELALGIFDFQYLTAHFWFMQVFMTFLVRYLCIFHPSAINWIADRVIINGTRTICSCWTLGAFMTENLKYDFTLNGYVKVMIHGFNPTDTKTTAFLNSFKIIILLDLIFVVFSLIRIEFYKWKSIDFESISKVTLRIFFTLIIFICVLVTLRLYLPMPIEYSALIFHIIVTFIIFVVIPALFILRSKNITEFAQNCIKRNAVSPLYDVNC